MRVSKVLFLVLAAGSFSLAGLLYWDMGVSDTAAGNYLRILHYGDRSDERPAVQAAGHVIDTELIPQDRAQVRQQAAQSLAAIHRRITRDRYVMGTSLSMGVFFLACFLRRKN